MENKKMTIKERFTQDLADLGISNPEELIDNAEEIRRLCRERRGYWYIVQRTLKAYLLAKEGEIEYLFYPTSEPDLYSKPFWKRKRKEILERDNYECRKCGQSDLRLEVHHIEPVKEFPDSECGEDGDAHHPDNLVTLCASCHHEMEPLPEHEQRKCITYE